MSTEKEKEHSHKVAVISNSYNILRHDAIDIIVGCEAVIHAGNFTDKSIYKRLGQITPKLYAVRGNDDGDWAAKLGHVMEFDLFRHRFFLVSDKKRTPGDNASEVMIYGSSNKFEAKKEDGRLIINPGSSGPKGFFSPSVMAVLNIGRKHITYEKIILKGEPEETPAETPDELPADLIKEICEDIDRGTDLKAVARVHNIKSELTARIARIYVTHPGVTPEEILAKMGI